MHKSATFPDPSRNLSAILIVNSSGLSSAICDGEHLAKLLLENMFAKHVLILSDNPIAQQNIEHGLKSKVNTSIQSNVNYRVCYSSSELLQVISSSLNGMEPNSDILICLSSHGYANGNNNDIIFCGHSVSDVDFHKCVLGNTRSDSRVLFLADCCQSGTFMNLRYESSDAHVSIHALENNDQTDELLNVSNVICIGAVSDNEYDMDDISDLGYDGGLSSAFIDYNLHQSQKSIGGFFEYYVNRINPTGKHPIISFNNLKFVE